MTASKNKSNKSAEVAAIVATTPVILARTYCQPIQNIMNIIASDATDTDILVEILTIAVKNVDESKLPLDRCTDSELNKRLSVVYSKKVPAKKLKEAEYMATIRVSVDPDHELTEVEATVREALIVKVTAKSLAADQAYDDLLAQEAEIKSFKTTQATRANTLNSDDADPSILNQLDLGKLIRNYQSKKSTVKKAMESASTATEILKQKNLVDYWQNKVDEASKYRTTSDASKKNVATNSKVADIIKGLESGLQTPEVASMIAQLKGLL